jgi:hypothetical protein
VNGPKDQAGGCLADLLFYGVNIQIYDVRNIYGNFFSRMFTQINSPQKIKAFLIDVSILFDTIIDLPDHQMKPNFSKPNFMLIDKT